MKIISKDDIPVRNVEHAQGGEGTVTFFDWLPESVRQGHGRVVSKLVIPPGASIGSHTHEGVEYEAFYVVMGSPTVTDDGTEYVLSPGDVHVCPTGSSHKTENKTGEDVVLMAFILDNLSDRFEDDGLDVKALKSGEGRFKVGDVVRHFKYDLATDEERAKNKFMYVIKDFVEDMHTGKAMVYYQPLYELYNCCVRPYEMFASEVDRQKYPQAKQKYRFEVVE